MSRLLIGGAPLQERYHGARQYRVSVPPSGPIRLNIPVSQHGMVVSSLGQDDVGYELSDIQRFIQKAVAESMAMAWPMIFQRIEESIPMWVEQFKPYVPELVDKAKPAIKKEVNRGALIFGGITVAAVAVTALICRRKK